MTRRWWRILLPLAVLLLGTGCANQTTETGLPALEDMNVLMIVIDTMGARHVGYLNEGLDTTPRIDALARDGVAFTQAYSPAPWTQPAVASLMTGLMPSNTGTIQIYDKLDPNLDTLAERLADRGFRTAGVISHFLIGRELEFAQGFESYDESAVVDHHRGISSPQVARMTLKKLDELKDERFFLFAHFFDPHSHYLHHPDYDRTAAYQGKVRGWDLKITELRKRLDQLDEADISYLRDLYREEIAFTDHYVGVILDKLEALGLRENTLVVLTADHGEEFMEHQWIGHTRFLYDTLVRVPLVISLPGRLAPREVPVPVSIVDIAPTLLGISRDPVTDFAWDGRSLAGLLEGQAPEGERLVFHEVSFPKRDADEGAPVDEKGTFLTAVTAGRWKLIHDLTSDGWSLFDRRHDPLELEDLYTEESTEISALQDALLAWEVGKVGTWGKGFQESPLIDEEVRKRLRSLGYIH